MKHLLLTVFFSLLFTAVSNADGFYVIPITKNSSTNSGANFDITADGSTFTSQSKGWAYAGSTGSGYSFFTNKGYYFNIIRTTDTPMVQFKRVYFQSAGCVGPSLVYGSIMPGTVYSSSTNLFYTKNTESNLGEVAYLSYRHEDGSCKSDTSTTWPDSRWAYPNDINVTGVHFTDPTDIKIVYKP